MSLQDSIVTSLNKVIDNRQVTTVIVSAALVGVGGVLYRLFDRYAWPPARGVRGDDLRSGREHGDAERRRSPQRDN